MNKDWNDENGNRCFRETGRRLASSAPGGLSGAGTSHALHCASDAMISVQQEPVGQTSVSKERQLCVLLVDDDGGIRSLLAEVLERLGHRVITASNGMRAVELFTQRKDEIGLVLMDYFMPGMDGGQAYKWIHELKPTIKVIIMSTVESLRLRQIFAREAITAYLHKPLQVAEVEYAIQKVMPKKISP